MTGSDPSDLLVSGHPIETGAGRLAADVQDVGALFGEAPPLGDRRVHVVAQAIAGERVQRYVKDSHHIGAAAPQELAATDGQR